MISGIMLKKFKAFAGEPAPFVMELPAYHAPSASNVLRSVWERGWSFIKRAGTIILLSTIILWFLSNFGFADGGFGWVEDSDASLLAAVGSVIAVIFIPLGFGNWQAAVATITGLIAKEEVVSTMQVFYPSDLIANIAMACTAASAYSFMVFNLLCAPLLRRYGCHQAGNEQRQVDLGCYRIYVRFCLCSLSDCLPVGWPAHRNCDLRCVDGGCSGCDHLSAGPQGLSG